MPAADGMEGWKGCFLRFGERWPGREVRNCNACRDSHFGLFPGTGGGGNMHDKPPVEVAVVDRVYSDRQRLVMDGMDTVFFFLFFFLCFFTCAL